MLAFGAAAVGIAIVIVIAFTPMAVLAEVGGSSSEQAATTPASTDQSAQSLEQDPNQAESSPATASGVVVSQLVDPTWVAETSERTGIPPRALAAYAGADLAMVNSTGCQVGWNTLAGISWVESHHGTLHGGSIGDDGVATPHIIGIALDGTTTASIPDSDGGALDGDATWDRAVGPMQFIPQTWAEWGKDGNGDGIADPHNIDDAALTAASYLCHAHGTLDGSEQWIGAIRSYNDTDDYQNQVATAAQHYADLAS